MYTHVFGRNGSGDEETVENGDETSSPLEWHGWGDEDEDEPEGGDHGVVERKRIVCPTLRTRRSMRKSASTPALSKMQEEGLGTLNPTHPRTYSNTHARTYGEKYRERYREREKIVLGST